MLSRTDGKVRSTAWGQPRVLLLTAVSVVALGFLIALEVAARHYGEPGPITAQAQEVIFAPKSGTVLYAGMALMMVVLTWKQRFIAVGAAVGIDVVFWLVRWAVDAEMMYGNGALWVTLACAVIALTRRTGRERLLLLQGVGLALLLVAGRKTGYTWLLITSKTRPMVLDQYVATADHALGNPSWLAGRIVEATGTVGAHVLEFVYIQLAVAAVAVALYQLRNVAVERRFPRHHLVRTFLVIGLLGPGIYMIFPVVGPILAYGADGGHWAVADLWPNTPPPVGTPHPMPFDEITPRNCMPSLHTAWATAIFIHSRKGPRPCASRARSGWSPRSAPRSASATTTARTSSPEWCSPSPSRSGCARSTAAGTGGESGWPSTAPPSSPRSWPRTATCRRRWPRTGGCSGR